MGKPAESSWLVTLKAVGIFMATFGLVFVLLESPALLKRTSYWLSHVGHEESVAPLAFLPKLRDRPVTLGEIKQESQAFFQPELQLAGYSLADLGENQLLIPKIAVKAPVVWDSSSDEASMLTSLEQGVAHYGFTGRPSGGRGNVFLSGHSSYSFWAPGNYKTVFANLDRLEPGDQLAITEGELVYLYEVRTKRVIKPTELSVLDPTEQSLVSLMTCVPVGTNLNRLIVQAELISANPTQPVPLPPPALTDPVSIFHYLPI